jgi:MFS transporter, MFS domain-containing protein family, molybdate-anion transporter
MFLIFGGLVVWKTWKENYGDRSEANSGKVSLVEGMRFVMNDVRILATGMIVSLYEGSMYTFVFLWGPVLEKGGASTPFGLIFASFMVCIMIGSILFRLAVREKYSVEAIIQPVLLVAALALALPSFVKNNYLAFWTFNVFELCCGLYFPAIGTIRSKYVPEETRATVMNIFRVPLNLIVVTVLLRVAQWSPEFIFAICAVLLLMAYVFAVVLSQKRK